MNSAYKSILFLSLLSLPLFLFGQEKRANKMYNQGQYAKAVELYNKVVSKKNADVTAYYNLGNSYRILNDYVNAEKYFGKAAGMKDAPKNTLLYYGQMLKINNKPQQAATQFKKYLGTNPQNAFLANLLINSCKKISAWEKSPASAKVKILSGINSTYSDFSPMIIDSNIVFTSNRGQDMVNDVRSSLSGKPFFSIYYKPMAGKNSDKIKLYSSQINKNNQNGPAAYCKKTSMLFFNVITSLNSKNKIIKLLISNEKNGKWSNPIPFKWNSDKYSIMHPAISQDGKTLYFSSDMPGGQGGFDIWKSTLNGNDWSKPVNMGKIINTPLNEAFPYVYNHTLYFASNGQMGFGGLDVFKYDAKNKKVINMGAPFNSSFDDFGILFTSDTTGYLSSNRPGGVGSDDIYSFTLIPHAAPHTHIRGEFTYSNLPASGIKVRLLSANDNPLDSTYTDKKGDFSFKQLDPDKNYLIVIGNDSVSDNAQLYLINSKGQKVLVANKLSRKMFSFKALPADQYNKLPILNIKDQSQLLTVGLSGQVYKTLPGDYSNKISVFVVDDKGNIIAQTQTDENGKFNFTKLPPDKQYLIKLKGADGQLKVIILDKNGKLLSVTDAKGNYTFKYKRLKSDKNLIRLLSENDQIITISPNENFKISGIYYDYGKYNINSEAADQLNKLVLIMKKNPQVDVILKSYTDSRGGTSYNLKLSQERADAAVAYVIEKGISKSRITSKGYGEADPVNGCVNGVPCTEDQYAMNRRTEIQIRVNKK